MLLHICYIKKLNKNQDETHYSELAAYDSIGVLYIISQCLETLLDIHI